MQKGTCERPAGSKPHSKGERVSEEGLAEGEKLEKKRTKEMKAEQIEKWINNAKTHYL